MEVFPFDQEIPFLFNQAYTEDKYSSFFGREQLEYYDGRIMGPFFEQMLGFKLDEIRDTIPYVARFFALPSDNTQPEQGDILSKSHTEDGHPEDVCVQEYFGLQTYNRALPDFLDSLGQFDQF